MVRYVNSFCCSKQPDNFEIPRIGRTFIGMIMLQSLCLIVLSGLLSRFHGPSQVGRVYGSLGFFCTAFLIFFGVDAVVSENKFQFIAYQIVQVAMTSFIAYETQNTELGAVWTSARYGVLGVQAAFQLASFVFAPLIWRSFGFYSYKVVGGSIPLIRMFHRRRAVLSLLKLDSFANLLQLLLVKAYLLSIHDPTLIVCLAFLGTSLLFAALMHRAVVRESRRLTYACVLLLSVAQPLFTGACLWWLWGHKADLPEDVSYPQFAIVGGGATLIRAAVVFLSLYCARVDYGRGLRSIIEEADRQVSKLPWCCHKRAFSGYRRDGADDGGEGILSGYESLLLGSSPGHGGLDHGLGSGHDRDAHGGLSPVSKWLKSRSPTQAQQHGSVHDGDGSSTAASGGSAPDVVPTPFKRWAVLLGPYVPGSPDNAGDTVLDHSGTTSGQGHSQNHGQGHAYTPTGTGRSGQGRASDTQLQWATPGAAGTGTTGGQARPATAGRTTRAGQGGHRAATGQAQRPAVDAYGRRALLHEVMDDQGSYGDPGMG